MKIKVLVLTLLSSVITFGQSFEEGEKIFKQNCAACHKMDKKVVGPALQNVVEEQGAEWVYEWVKNNQSLRESGDSHANEVYEEFNGSAMPAYEWLGDESLENVVTYLGEWKGAQQASVLPTPTQGPTMVQQAPYEMPLTLKIFVGLVTFGVFATMFAGVKTTKLVAEAYTSNQVMTTYLMKKADMTADQTTEEFDEFIEGEVSKRVDKKVKELKKDINSKLKDFS